MGFFERKLKEWEDYKQRQELMAQEQRQIEEARKQAEIDRKKEYCIWYTKQIHEFLDELQENNFTPVWGFEVETVGSDHFSENYSGLRYDGTVHGSTYVIDIHDASGLAFDPNSKQLCYYKIGGAYYENYKKPLDIPIYSYKLIPFSEIICARIETDSQTTVSTISAGGAIIGSVVAVNESMSESSVSTTPREIDFYIQTKDNEYPIISFEFKHHFMVKHLSETYLLDSMCGLFSREKELLTMNERPVGRKCGTTVDLRYDRYYGYKKSSIDSIFNSKIRDLTTILKGLKIYTMKIDAIIQQCNKDSMSQSNSKNSLADEIAKLAEMKANGIITEEEFRKLKSKIIETL